MDRNTPSPTFRVPKSSPLESLVRRASSRRTKAKDALQVPATPPRPAHPDDHHTWHSPPSPLLHTQFRTSVASTAPSTYNYDASSFVSESDRSTVHAGYYDPNASRTRDRDRASHSSHLTAQRELSMASQYSVDDILAAANMRDSTTLGAPPAPPTSSPYSQSHRPAPPDLPAVVVSAESVSEPQHLSHAGRVPSRLPPGTANFSRPVPSSFTAASHPYANVYAHAPDVLPPQTQPPTQPLPPPPRPPVLGSEEQKRQVLMRNAQGSSSIGVEGRPSSSSLARGLPPSASAQLSPDRQIRRSASQADSIYSNYSYYAYDGSPVPSPEIVQGASQPRPQSKSQSQSRSHSPSQPHPQPQPQTPSHSPSQPQIQPQTQSRSRPPSQPQTQPYPQARPQAQSQPTPMTRASKSPSLSASAPTTSTAGSDPKTPQDFLQLGIAHHLANRLPESAACFEQSAVRDGGCGVGMLMWGLAQRHGWGVPKDEDKGFRWLRKAAEMAVGDLESGKEIDRGAVKSELVLAIYEVGQSFFRGWGVEKDKKMAVSYFQLAAKLGDPDAQQDLAFCLANGKGCKKDKREAARWYRAAVAQGASDIGLAWIHKEKYQ